MNFTAMSDKAILAEVGERISRQRLNRNMTQEDLAVQAGVARQVVHRVESGKACTTGSLIRILRALGLLEQFDAFLPAPEVSPLQLAKLRGRVRLRAAGRRARRPSKEG